MLSSAGGSQPVQGIHVRPRGHATLEVRRRSANGRSRSTSLMAGPWKSGLLLVTRFNPADKRNIGMKQIILPVAVVGLAIGGTLAFAQVNPSAPPAPQSMHQPAPAVDAPRAAKKTVTALSDLKKIIAGYPCATMCHALRFSDRFCAMAIAPRRRGGASCLRSSTASS